MSTRHKVLHNQNRADVSQERESEKTIEVVTRQLGAVAKVLSKEEWSKVVIAYEPIWCVPPSPLATE